MLIVRSFTAPVSTPPVCSAEPAEFFRDTYLFDLIEEVAIAPKAT